MIETVDRPSSYYQRGVITLAKGSLIVTGKNTCWQTPDDCNLALPMAGNLLTIDKDHYYPIAAVISDTELQLAWAYQEPDVAFTGYGVLTNTFVDADEHGDDIAVLTQMAKEYADAAFESEKRAEAEANRSQDAAEYAETVVSGIEDSVADAEAAALAAEQSALAAKQSEEAAALSEQAAKDSEQAALASEQAAFASEEAAALSEADAQAAALSATASQLAADQSAADALASEIKAKDSEDAALASERAAFASETAASDSETAADLSAQAASASETAADLSEQAAAASAKNSQQSSILAAASAVSAQRSETQSGVYASESESSAIASNTQANRSEDEADRAASIASSLNDAIRNGNTNALWYPSSTNYPTPTDVNLPEIWFAQDDGTIDGVPWQEGQLCVWEPELQIFYRVAGESLDAGGGGGPFVLTSSLIIPQTRGIFGKDSSNLEDKHLISLDADDDIVVGHWDGITPYQRALGDAIGRVGIACAAESGASDGGIWAVRKVGDATQQFRIYHQGFSDELVLKDGDQDVNGQKTFRGSIDLANLVPLRVDFVDDNGDYRDTGEVFKATAGNDGVLEAGTGLADFHIFAKDKIVAREPVEQDNPPTQNNHLANKAYVDSSIPETSDFVSRTTGQEITATHTIKADDAALTLEQATDANRTYISFNEDGGLRGGYVGYFEDLNGFYCTSTMGNMVLQSDTGSVVIDADGNVDSRATSSNVHYYDADQSGDSEWSVRFGNGGTYTTQLYTNAGGIGFNDDVNISTVNTGVGLNFNGSTTNAARGLSFQNSDNSRNAYIGAEWDASIAGEDGAKRIALKLSSGGQEASYNGGAGVNIFPHQSEFYVTDDSNTLELSFITGRSENRSDRRPFRALTNDEAMICQPSDADRASYVRFRNSAAEAIGFIGKGSTSSDDIIIGGKNGDSIRLYQGGGMLVNATSTLELNTSTNIVTNAGNVVCRHIADAGNDNAGFRINAIVDSTTSRQLGYIYATQDAKGSHDVAIKAYATNGSDDRGAIFLGGGDRQDILLSATQGLGKVRSDSLVQIERPSSVMTRFVDGGRDSSPTSSYMDWTNADATRRGFFGYGGASETLTIRNDCLDGTGAIDLNNSAHTNGTTPSIQSLIGSGWHNVAGASPTPLTLERTNGKSNINIRFSGYEGGTWQNMFAGSTLGKFAAGTSQDLSATANQFFLAGLDYFDVRAGVLRCDTNTIFNTRGAWDGSGSQASWIFDGSIAAGTKNVMRKMRENSSSTIVWEGVRSGNLEYSTGTSAGSSSTIRLDVSAGAVFSTGLMQSASAVNSGGDVTAYLGKSATPEQEKVRAFGSNTEGDKNVNSYQAMAKMIEVIEAQQAQIEALTARIDALEA